MEDMVEDVIDIKYENSKQEAFFDVFLEQFAGCAVMTGIIQNSEEGAMQLVKAFSRLKGVEFKDLEALGEAPDTDGFVENNKDGTKIIIITNNYKSIIEDPNNVNASELDNIKKTLFHEFLHLMQPRNLQPIYKEVGAELGALKMFECYEREFKGNRETETVLKPVGDVRDGIMAPCIIRNKQEQYSDFDKIPIRSSYPFEIAMILDIAKSLGRKPSEFINSTFSFNNFVSDLAVDYDKATGKSFFNLTDMLNESVYYPNKTQMLEDDKGKKLFDQIRASVNNLKAKKDIQEQGGLQVLQI